MPVEFTIYIEQDVDLTTAMDALDEFIHAQKWCDCESDKSEKHFAVWSAHAIDDSGDPGKLLARSGD